MTATGNALEPGTTTGKMRVTAVIDTYNYGHYIEQAVESVLGQDFPPEQLEILVVDDGSTDDTRQRMAKYAGQVTYLYKENGGQASAFNYGISRARGDIIAFLDADDYWLPGKLRRVADEFEKHPDAGLVYHPFREFREQTGEWRDGQFNAVSGNVRNDKRRMLEYTAAQTSGLSFRARYLREMLPLNEAMTIQADGLLAALVIFLAPVVAIPCPLAVYRIHGANLFFQSSKQIDKDKQARRIATLRVILREMDDWLQKRGHDLKKPEILAFRRRWQLLYEKEEFEFEKPGRMRFFWHVLQSMACMNPCLSVKIQTVNAMNAAGCLLFGYDNYDRLDEWRVGLKRKLANRRHPRLNARKSGGIS